MMSSRATVKRIRLPGGFRTKSREIILPGRSIKVLGYPAGGAVSPILVRPVREQLEHDRLIRHLLTKYKKKTNEVIANLGDEQVVPVKIGNVVLFPDLVISDAKKLTGLVEVETGESVNNLEAMASGALFARPGGVPLVRASAGVRCSQAPV
jgi:hypothetical protein